MKVKPRRVSQGQCEISRCQDDNGLNTPVYIAVVFAAAILLASCARKQTPTQSAEEQGKQIIQSLAAHEQMSMEEILSSWGDAALINKYSSSPLTDEGIKGLYSQFESSLVSPPDPDLEEYLLKNGNQYLRRTTDLGKLLHNRVQALLNDETEEQPSEKYLYLLGCMRDTLLLDAMHIPLAARGDRSRDVYWYELHQRGVQAAREEFERLFPARNSDK